MLNENLIINRVEKWSKLDFNDSHITKAIRKLKDTTFVLMDDDRFNYYDKNEPYVIYLGEYTYCRKSILELTEARMFIALVSDVLNVMSNYYIKYKADYTDMLNIRGKAVKRLIDTGNIDGLGWYSRRFKDSDYAKAFDKQFADRLDRYPVSKTSNNKAMLLRYVAIEEGWKGLVDIQVLTQDNNVIEFGISSEYSGYLDRYKNIYKYSLSKKKMLSSNTTEFKEFDEVRSVLAELNDL